MTRLIPSSLAAMLPSTAILAQGAGGTCQVFRPALLATGKLASRRLLLPSLLVLMGLLSACNRPSEEPDLVLLYTGNVNGYIEPCGCVAGQIGGIDRVAGYIEDQQVELGERGLFIDTGDLFSEGILADANINKQLGVKAKGFLDVWKGLGCDGVALGEAEVGLGVDQLKQLAQETGIVVLAGNVVDGSGAYPFATSIIVERGGFKIGIFSLLGETMREPKPKKSKKKLKAYDLRAALGEQGYQLQPWRQRAADLVAELRPKVDLLFCASHLGFNRNVLLAKEYPEIDLVFGGHYGNSEGQTTMIGDTPVLTNRIRGSRVGRMEWWLPAPEQYLARDNGGTHGTITNVSAYDEALIGMQVSRQVYGELTGMERKFGSVDWLRKRETQMVMFDESLKDLKQLKEIDPNPSGNRFSNNQVPMHHGVRRSSAALRAVDEFHESSSKLWPVNSNQSSALGSVFAGSEACVKCHRSQYEFWLGTRHSRAFATLEATSQEKDAECIGCHTIGYGNKGGFERPGQSSGFENVQCASCHGSGAAHIAGGASYMRPGVIGGGLNGCARCHRDEHDPDFAQEGPLRLGKVRCPPLAPVGLSSPSMKLAYLEVAHSFEKSKRPNWDLISRAYAGSGDAIKALNAARRWVKAVPRDLEARLNLAERALNVGEAEVALRNYRIATSEDPDSARAWAGLAWSLLANQPEESLTAAREAYAIDPNNVYGARLVAMGLMATGQPEQARKLMDKHIALHPSHESQLLDLLSQIPAPE